eukprot:268418_1
MSISRIHDILGGKYAEEAPPKIDTEHWPSPQDHNLDLLQQTFSQYSQNNSIEQYLNMKEITRPKYMFDTDKIIAIDDTVEYKKESQYLAALSVAILFLHKIRDIPSTQKQLWDNIIDIIIYLIDHGARIDESFVFHERSSHMVTRPDWILYTPLYLLHLLLSYTTTKYHNHMRFKPESIRNLFHSMIRNCCSQLPSMYTIRIYVDNNNRYQRGFDHRFFGNIFKKVPCKHEIHNLLLRGIQPFKLCTRLKDNDFLLNKRKEREITLNQMKQISGDDFERFSIPIYIYALVQQFKSIHNELLLLLKPFNRVYGVFDDIWNCVLSFMYQDVMDFCAPKMDLSALKQSILCNIHHVRNFSDEADFEFWLMDLLNDTQLVHQIDIISLCNTWHALMHQKLWNCIYALSPIIIQKDDFVSFIQDKVCRDLATDIVNQCCHLTQHSTYFIDIFYEILKHCDTLKQSKYFVKLKFPVFVKHVFGHLNMMEKGEKRKDDDIDDHESEEQEEDTEERDDDDWNIEDISGDEEDTNALTHYMNHMTRQEIVDKSVVICERMYALGAFRPIKKRKLLIDILSNAQSKGCVKIIAVLVANSWDINGVIDGSKFGWSVAVCAEYPVHDEVLQYVFSLEPTIYHQWQEMYLFLYLIQMRERHLNDQHLIKFCEYLKTYAASKGWNDVLLDILTQQVSYPKDMDVLGLFQASSKYLSFCKYLERLIETLKQGYSN